MAQNTICGVLGFYLRNKKCSFHMTWLYIPAIHGDCAIPGMGGAFAIETH